MDVLRTVIGLFLMCHVDVVRGFFGIDHGRVLPDDPYYFVNETSYITCTLYDTSLVNASSLFFEYYDKIVDSSYYKILNKSTIVLQKVMEKSDEGKFYCFENVTKVLIGGQDVQVDYPLEPVNDITCIWHHWRESLECSWELPPYHMWYINVTLEWRNGGGAASCPNMSDQKKCTWRQEDNISLETSSFQFKVTVQNTHRIRGYNVTGESITKIPKDNVKPKKVNPDHFNARFTNDSSCLQLVWRYYNDTLSERRKKIFRIKYYPNHQPEQKQIVLTKVNAQSVALCGLHASTTYNITVDVHPANETGIWKGYWSDAVTKLFKTDEDVPAAAPEMIVGGYERDVDGCDFQESGKKTGNFTIYWKTIPESQTNGMITKLNVTYAALSGVAKHVTLTDRQATSTVLSLDCNMMYDVKVTAATKKGFSPHFSSIWVNTSVVRPPAVIVEQNEDRFNVSWIVNDPVDFRTEFVVIYCEKQGLGCSDEIHYKEVENWKERNRLLTLQSDKSYLFGVSAVKGAVGRGVRFQSCIYDGRHHTFPRAPDFTVDNRAGDNTLRVKWTPIPCSSDTPYIVSYTIVWCKTNKEKHCTGSEHSIIIPATADTNEYVIGDLKRDVTHGIKMRSSSYREKSLFSEMTYGQPVSSDLKSEEIVGVAIGGIVCLIFVIAGVMFAIRVSVIKCRRIAEPFKVDIPDIQRFPECPPSPSNSTDLSSDGSTQYLLPDNHGNVQIPESHINNKENWTNRQFSRDSGRGSSHCDEQDGHNNLDPVSEESIGYVTPPAEAGTTSQVTSGNTSNDANAYSKVVQEDCSGHAEGSSGDENMIVTVAFVQEQDFVHFTNTEVHHAPTKMVDTISAQAARTNKCEDVKGKTTDIDSKDPSVPKADDVPPTFTEQNCNDNLVGEYTKHYKVIPAPAGEAVLPPEDELKTSQEETTNSTEVTLPWSESALQITAVTEPLGNVAVDQSLHDQSDQGDDPGNIPGNILPNSDYVSQNDRNLINTSPNSDYISQNDRNLVIPAPAGEAVLPLEDELKTPQEETTNSTEVTLPWSESALQITAVTELLGNVAVEPSLHDQSDQGDDPGNIPGNILPNSDYVLQNNMNLVNTSPNSDYISQNDMNLVVPAPAGEAVLPPEDEPSQEETTNSTEVTLPRSESALQITVVTEPLGNVDIGSAVEPSLHDQSDQGDDPGNISGNILLKSDYVLQNNMNLVNTSPNSDYISRNDMNLVVPAPAGEAVLPPEDEPSQEETTNSTEVTLPWSESALQITAVTEPLGNVAVEPSLHDQSDQGDDHGNISGNILPNDDNVLQNDMTLVNTSSNNGYLSQNDMNLLNISPNSSFISHNDVHDDAC